MFQLQPIALRDTHVGMCSHRHMQKHCSPSAPGRGEPHSSFYLPAPFSACCWHHYMNTNIIFLSSSLGCRGPFISLFLLRAFREWRWGLEGIWDMGELWETRVQFVASQQAALSLSSRSHSPSLSLFLFWQRIYKEASCRSHIAASNDLGKHALFNASRTSEPCSTPQRKHSVCLFLQGLCVVLVVYVFYLHVVSGVAPVPHGVHVAQAEALLLTEVNLCHRTTDLARHEV